jgi:hypothetical protein
MEEKTRIDEIIEGLKKDLEGAKSTRKYTLIFGIVIVLLFSGLFTFSSLTIRKNLRPDTLADVAAFSAREAIVQGRPLVEEAFRVNIPVFLRNLRQSLLNDLIPLLRKDIEKQLQSVVEKSIASSSMAFNNAVTETIRTVKTLSSQPGKIEPEFLAQLITREFENEKKKRYSEFPAQTLGSQFEESKKILNNLKRKLELVVSRKPLTKEDALELQFIKAWVSLLHRGEPEGTPQGAPAPAPTPPALPEGK